MKKKKPTQFGHLESNKQVSEPNVVHKQLRIMTISQVSDLITSRIGLHND